MRTKLGKFSSPYTKRVIIDYLKAVKKSIGKSPTFRELDIIPGPSSRTIIRRFGTWTKALKSAGIRPSTNQLMKGEKTYIRKNWKTMTDKQISLDLGLSVEIIKYYRIQYKLWKNKKGTARSTYRKKALSLYGKSCEVCGLNICEWHHIVPKSKSQLDWCILCPTCHAVVTRKLVVLRSRDDIREKLIPYMRVVYQKLSI